MSYIVTHEIHKDSWSLKSLFRAQLILSKVTLSICLTSSACTTDIASLTAHWPIHAFEQEPTSYKQRCKYVSPLNGSNHIEHGISLAHDLMQIHHPPRRKDFMIPAAIRLRIILSKNVLISLAQPIHRRLPF